MYFAWYHCQIINYQKQGHILSLFTIVYAIVNPIGFKVFSFDNSANSSEDNFFSLCNFSGLEFMGEYLGENWKVENLEKQQHMQTDHSKP